MSRFLAILKLATYRRDEHSRHAASQCVTRSSSELLTPAKAHYSPASAFINMPLSK